MLLIYLLIDYCYGFNWVVHRHLGNLLKVHLEPDKYNNIVNILNEEDLVMNYYSNSYTFEDVGSASVWADKVKNSKKFSYTKPYHYGDIEDVCKTKELPCPKSGCVYKAIDNLRYEDGSMFYNANRKEKLKFLLHFLQDITQPLHVCGKSRGGNGIKVIRNKNNRNKTTNLHFIWDSEIPQTYIQTEKYVYTPKNTTILDVVNYNLELCCKKMYNFTDNYIVFESYYEAGLVKDMFDNFLNLANVYF
jgi:hypothetical protein